MKDEWDRDREAIERALRARRVAPLPPDGPFVSRVMGCVRLQASRPSLWEMLGKEVLWRWAMVGAVALFVLMWWGGSQEQNSIRTLPEYLETVALAETPIGAWEGQPE